MFQELLIRIARELNASRIPYMVIGGQAVLLYGEPRLTFNAATGVGVQFALLEDLVIHKVIAGRPRDIEDVKSILLKNPAFDRQYITAWLSEFDKGLDTRYADAFNTIVAEIKGGG